MFLLDLFKRKASTPSVQSRCSAGRGTPAESYASAKTEPRKRRQRRRRRS